MGLGLAIEGPRCSTVVNPGALNPRSSVTVYHLAPIPALTSPFMACLRPPPFDGIPSLRRASLLGRGLVLPWHAFRLYGIPSPPDGIPFTLHGIPVPLDGVPSLVMACLP